MSCGVVCQAPSVSHAPSLFSSCLNNLPLLPFRSKFWEEQECSAFCGIASSAIILTAFAHVSGASEVRFAPPCPGKCPGACLCSTKKPCASTGNAPACFSATSCVLSRVRAGCKRSLQWTECVHLREAATDAWRTYEQPAIYQNCVLPHICAGDPKGLSSGLTLVQVAQVLSAYLSPKLEPPSACGFACAARAFKAAPPAPAAAAAAAVESLHAGGGAGATLRVRQTTSFTSLLATFRRDLLRVFGPGATPSSSADASPFADLKQAPSAAAAAPARRCTGFIIINFYRRLHPRRGGHFSPLAGYHAASDSVLVLDVSPNYRPHWVSVQRIVQSMNTLDGRSVALWCSLGTNSPLLFAVCLAGVSKQPRGYILVMTAPPPPVPQPSAVAAPSVAVAAAAAAATPPSGASKPLLSLAHAPSPSALPSATAPSLPTASSAPVLIASSAQLTSTSSSNSASAASTQPLPLSLPHVPCLALPRPNNCCFSAKQFAATAGVVAQAMRLD